MEKSSFFNSIQASDGSYDREYLAEDFAKYFASFIGNGVFPNPSTNLQVLSNNNMTVSIDIGKAFINGYYYENTTKLVKTIDVADGVLNRIDLVVLRLDYINREIKVYVKEGTFASTPKSQSLQRDSDMYELALAELYIGAGATTITQANITDLRLDTDSCGVVTDVVNTVDVTTLYNQYQNLFEQKIIKNQADFDAWFSTIKDTLSGDTAGKLQNEIDSLNINKVDYVDMTPKTTEGTASAYTVELSDAMNEVTIIPHVDNEEGATLNGLEIKNSDGDNIGANVFKLGIPVKLVRIGSNFFMCSTSKEVVFGEATSRRGYLHDTIGSYVVVKNLPFQPSVVVTYQSTSDTLSGSAEVFFWCKDFGDGYTFGYTGASKGIATDTPSIQPENGFAIYAPGSGDVYNYIAIK